MSEYIYLQHSWTVGAVCLTQGRGCVGYCFSLGVGSDERVGIRRELTVGKPSSGRAWNMKWTHMLRVWCVDVQGEEHDHSVDSRLEDDTPGVDEAGCRVSMALFAGPVVGGGDNTYNIFVAVYVGYVYIISSVFPK